MIFEMLPWITFALTAVLRFFWISDTEFKGDEAKFISLLSQPIEPLSPVAAHSGIAHSNGGLILIKALSFGTLDPIWLASLVALLNVFAISFSVYICRKSEKAVFTLLMCATSFNLVLGSRKVWIPDLVAVWIHLFLGLFLYSQMEPRNSGTSAALVLEKKKKKAALVASGFCVLFAGHMYLPGLVIGASAAFFILSGFFLQKEKQKAQLFLAGCLLGALTWCEYFYLILSHAEGTFASGSSFFSFLGRAGNWQDLKSIVDSAFFVVSPYGSEKLYLLRSMEYLKNAPEQGLLGVLLFVLFVLRILWGLIFAASLGTVIRQRKKARQDFLLIASLGTLVSFIFALQILKIGNYLHYWFGVMPLAYYIVGWSATSSDRFSRKIKQSVWAGMSGSVVALFLFFLLVRQLGGLPGEYWMSYRAQLLSGHVIQSN